LKPKVAGVQFLNMLKAHSVVYDSIKSKYPDLQVWDIALTLSHASMHLSVRLLLAILLLADLWCNTHSVSPSLKDQTVDKTLQVGLVHQFIEMKSSASWNLLGRWIAKWMTAFFAKDVVLQWFTTGIYHWRMPFWMQDIKYTSTSLPKLDFLGMNYYSRLMISPFFQLVGAPGEVLSDTKFPMHPSGLTRHLKDAKVLGVPIYITEFGAADREDRMRPQLIREYYIAVCAVISQECSGLDVGVDAHRCSHCLLH
jgi:hypothetical protein